MVINYSPLHCICDFTQCTEEIRVEGDLVLRGSLNKLLEENWRFIINTEMEILEVYCPLHKHRIPNRGVNYEILQSSRSI